MRILESVSKNPAPSEPAPNINRFERMLAIMLIALIAISLICFVAVIAGTSLGVGNNDGFSHGIWPTVFMVPYLGLPLAFLMLVGLLISNGIRRQRAATGGKR